MTREEAMQRLTDLQDGSGQTYEAIRMAIEALSAEAEYSKLLQTALNGIPIVDLTDGKTKLKEEDWVYDTTPSAEIPTESTNTPTNTPTDLISRAEAIEAVRKSKTQECAVWNVRELPSADAVEVVRCRNCYYAEDDITHMFCVYFGHKVYGDDYCSNAVERREDGEA